MKPDQETDRLLGGGSTPIPKDVARVKSPDCRRLLHKTGSSAEDSSGRGGNYGILGFRSSFICRLTLLGPVLIQINTVSVNFYQH